MMIAGAEVSVVNLNMRRHRPWSQMHYPSVASLAKALTAAAVTVPVMGLPWPPASTVGSSRGQPFD